MGSAVNIEDTAFGNLDRALVTLILTPEGPARQQAAATFETYNALAWRVHDAQKGVSLPGLLDRTDLDTLASKYSRCRPRLPGLRPRG